MQRISHAICLCALATPCAAFADPMGVSPPAFGSGAFEFLGPTTGGAGPTTIISGGLPSLFANTPSVPRSNGFSYAWEGAGYSTNIEVVYSIASNINSTTVTGTLTLTTEITNATLIPATIHASGQFNVFLDIFVGCSVSSSFFSTPGDPTLATIAYWAGGTFAAPGAPGPLATLSSFNSVGFFGSGPCSVSLSLSNDLTVTNSNSGPQVSSISFEIVATVPAPAAAALFGPVCLFAARRRR